MLLIKKFSEERNSNQTGRHPLTLSNYQRHQKCSKTCKGSNNQTSHFKLLPSSNLSFKFRTNSSHSRLPQWLQAPKRIASSKGTIACYSQSLIKPTKVHRWARDSSKCLRKFRLLSVRTSQKDSFKYRSHLTTRALILHQSRDTPPFLNLIVSSRCVIRSQSNHLKGLKADIL